MKNAVSLKRDLGSLSETSWVYILSASEVKAVGDFKEKNCKLAGAVTMSYRVHIFFFFFFSS